MFSKKNVNDENFEADQTSVNKCYAIVDNNPQHNSSNKLSNLHGRWRRKTTSTQSIAAIYEIKSKGNDIVKPISIETAERLDYSDKLVNHYDKSRNFNKNYRCKNSDHRNIKNNFNRCKYSHKFDGHQCNDKHVCNCNNFKIAEFFISFLSKCKKVIVFPLRWLTTEDEYLQETTNKVDKSFYNKERSCNCSYKSTYKQKLSAICKNVVNKIKSFFHYIWKWLLASTEENGKSFYKKNRNAKTLNNYKNNNKKYYKR